MRVIRAIAAVLVALATPVAASLAAAPVPPNVLISGTTMASDATASALWCSIDRGATTFQRDGAAKGLMSFQDITLFDAGYYRLAGLAQLKFDSPTSGVAIFDMVDGYPASIRRPVFTGYTQTYRKARGELKVSFDLHLGGCTLPVTAIYRH
ncbi:hypothetical protein [Microbaculum marinum]|uniref:Secreted protein n=1 Tax=Microbaculum marinum TaxID=1764581 RepID=A0AAW9RCZ8_9HYPH